MRFFTVSYCTSPWFHASTARRGLPLFTLHHRSGKSTCACAPSFTACSNKPSRCLLYLLPALIVHNPSSSALQIGLASNLACRLPLLQSRRCIARAPATGAQQGTSSHIPPRQPACRHPHHGASRRCHRRRRRPGEPSVDRFRHAGHVHYRCVYVHTSLFRPQAARFDPPPFPPLSLPRGRQTYQD